MLRETKAPESGEVIADMSQFSIDSGRLNMQQQYENLVKEREILKKRKLELEQQVAYYKKRSPYGRISSVEDTERRRIVEEIAEIQKRLIVIKPNMTNLHNKLHRNDAEILEDILCVLQQISKKLDR